MKKIINGIRYNTDSAKIIGRHQSPCWPNGMNAWEATLYRAPMSETYYLVGSGGFLTRFRGASEKLVPMTIEEAQEFADQYLK